MINVESAVLKVLTELLAMKGKEPPELNEKTLNGSFEQFDLDSMDKLDFAMGLEDALGAVFVTSEITKCKTLADVIAFAERAQRPG